MNSMKCILIATVASLFAQTAARAEYADGVYFPPLTKAAVEEQIHAVPQAQAADWAQNVHTPVVFADFAGLNAQLTAEHASTKLHEVAEGISLGFDASDVFEPTDGGRFVAEFMSLDAYALRIELDLSMLRDGDALHVVDPTGPRAFGPYTAEDQTGPTFWSPVIDGERIVLVLESADGLLPSLRILTLSHFFRPLNDAEGPKQLSCNLNLECQSPAFRQVASAIGLLVIAGRNGGQAVCSGSLITNTSHGGPEPYFMTANHCVPQFGPASSTQVIWDFRALRCDSNETPSLAELPRSAGMRVLATCADLDATLIELDNAPIGEFGRMFLGWDTREPQLGEAIFGIHHPAGDFMRASFGEVTGVDERVFAPQFGLDYFLQTRVVWADGVTEGGSSGSPLIFERNFRITGMLSNGPRHNCADPSENFDRFASFRDFFVQVRPFLLFDSDGPPSIVCDFGGFTVKFPGCATSDVRSGGPSAGDLAIVMACGPLLGLRQWRRSRYRP